MIDQPLMGRVREVAKIHGEGRSFSNLAIKASYMSIKAQEHHFKPKDRLVLIRNMAESIIAIYQAASAIEAEDVLEAELTSRMAYIEDSIKTRLEKKE